jgi:hypothetical protein
VKRDLKEGEATGSANKHSRALLHWIWKWQSWAMLRELDAVQLSVQERLGYSSIMDSCHLEVTLAEFKNILL